MDLAANEKAVHGDFFNGIVLIRNVINKNNENIFWWMFFLFTDFEDLFDDDDLK